MAWLLLVVGLLWAYVDFRKYVAPVDDSKPILLWVKQWIWGDPVNLWPKSCFRFNGYYFYIAHTRSFAIYEIWARKIGNPIWKKLRVTDYPEFNLFIEIARDYEQNRATKQKALKKPKMTKKEREARWIEDIFHPTSVPNGALSKAESIVDQEKGLSRLVDDEVPPESVSA